MEQNLFFNPIKSNIKAYLMPAYTVDSNWFVLNFPYLQCVSSKNPTNGTLTCVDTRSANRTGSRVVQIEASLWKQTRNLNFLLKNLKQRFNLQIFQEVKANKFYEWKLKLNSNNEMFQICFLWTKNDLSTFFPSNFFIFFMPSLNSW